MRVDGGAAGLAKTSDRQTHLIGFAGDGQTGAVLDRIDGLDTRPHDLRLDRDVIRNRRQFELQHARCAGIELRKASDARAARTEIFDCHALIVPPCVEVGIDEEAVRAAQLLDSRDASGRQQRSQHRLQCFGCGVDANSGDEFAGAHRIGLRPHDHGFHRDRRRTPVDDDAQNGFVPHLELLRVLETRAFDRDIAHRDDVRPELRRQRRSN